MIARCPVCGETFDPQINHNGSLHGPLRTFCSKGCKSRKNNPPERQRRYRLKRRYGLTPDKYDDLLAAQGGGCAICGTCLDGVSRRLPIDHDHTTGAVRGILCTMCNPGLGYFRDDPDLLRAAAAYLDSVTKTNEVKDGSSSGK